MKKGEKAQVVCPSSAAYGDRGQPPDIPPGATLSFEVELLDFRKLFRSEYSNVPFRDLRP